MWLQEVRLGETAQNREKILYPGFIPQVWLKMNKFHQPGGKCTNSTRLVEFFDSGGIAGGIFFILVESFVKIRLKNTIGDSKNDCEHNTLL